MLTTGPAGALSKTVEKTFVWTYLFDVEHTDIEWPLAQFQHTKAEEADTRKAVHTINQAVGTVLDKNQLDALFNIMWPELETRLGKIPAAERSRNLAGPKGKSSMRYWNWFVLLTKRLRHSCQLKNQARKKRCL